ncbi:MAG: hypothetical protein GY942_25750, partial [Aestuariibacter sp.]|nr:hypothetical protein [Aestuariibacter sp.]
MDLELEELANAVRYGNAENVIDIVKGKLQRKEDPQQVLNGMITGIQALG